MPNPPKRRFTRIDPREAAENVFKRVAPEPPPAPPATGTAHPPARELVSIRIDRDVLEYFQEDGPGWQDRINAALRGLVSK